MNKYLMAALFILLFCFERSTKLWAILDDKHTLNEGAAWNFVKVSNGVMIGISLAVLIIASAVYFKIKKDTYVHIAFGLIEIGALSNLIDRIIYGGVIDFIDIKVLPVFNLADMMLTCGMILLIWRIIYEKKDKSR